MEVGEVYKTEAEYEAMTIEELTEAYNDLDLRRILQRVFGMDSTVYFIDKAQKLQYVSSPDLRPEILAAGEDRRAVHRDMNRENRSKPSRGVADRIEEETKDRQYRLVRVDRDRESSDAFTGRPIRIVYVIEDVADGAEFDVSRGSCRWLEARDRIEGFAGAARGRQSVAHSAGRQSAQDLLGGQPAPRKRKKEAPVQEEPVTEEQSVADDYDIEDLLNSLPS